MKNVRPINVKSDEVVASQTKYGEALSRHQKAIRSVNSGEFEFIFKNIYGEAGDLRSTVFNSLVEAQTYFLSSNVIKLLQDNVQNYSDARLTRDMLVSRDGYVWLQEIVPEDDLILRSGTKGIQAISWLSTDVGYVPPDPKYPLGSSMFTLWMTDKYGNRPAPLILIPWMIGYRISETFEGEGINGIKDFAATYLPFIATMLSFMQQKILQVSKLAPPKDTEYVYVPKGPKRDSPIQIVTLRRKEYVRDEEYGHHDVDWSCRWEVAEHWRTYHTRNGPIKKLIAKHEKGPKDKPLRKRIRINAVVH